MYSGIKQNMGGFIKGGNSIQVSYLFFSNAEHFFFLIVNKFRSEQQQQHPVVYTPDGRCLAPEDSTVLSLPLLLTPISLMSYHKSHEAGDLCGDKTVAGGPLGLNECKC